MTQHVTPKSAHFFTNALAMACPVSAEAHITLAETPGGRPLLHAPLLPVTGRTGRPCFPASPAAVAPETGFETMIACEGHLYISSPSPEHVDICLCCPCLPSGQKKSGGQQKALERAGLREWAE